MKHWIRLLCLSLLSIVVGAASAQNVAKIGTTEYATLQEAVDAAHDMSGDVTITLIANTSGYAIVHQKAGLNLTIGGDNKTLNGQIVIDGDARYNGEETLTIKNINFSGNNSNFLSGLEPAFISVPKPAFVGNNNYNYAHNITIFNCSFTSTSNDHEVVGFKVESNAGCTTVVLKNCTGTNLHSLGQIYGTKDVTIDNCSATETGNFIGVNNGTGEFNISNCTFESASWKTDGYAYREKSSSTAVATLTNNNFKAHDAIILGSAGTIYVESGTYDGVISKTAGTIAVTGGTFSQPVDENLIAEGYGCYGNADGTFTVKEGTAVATIGGNKQYETLETAFAAAQDGETITLLANCAGNGIKAPEGKFTNGLTVDFGGFTYTVDGATVGSSGTETQAFQLLKNNKITFKNGTIYSEKAKMLVQNYSDLTLQGMTLDGSALVGSGRYTLSNNNGNVVIDNSTITAKTGEGNYAFDVCRYSSYPSVNVTVTGNSNINGDIEVDAGSGDAKDGFSLMLAGGTHTGKIVLTNNAETAMEATPDKAVIQKSDSYVQDAPEGYKWVSDGNGTSTLAPITYIAQIGTTKYETIAAAVAAATEGQTVEVIMAGEYTLPGLPKNITVEGAVDGVVFNHTTAGNVAAIPNGATFKNVEFNFGNVNYHGFQHAGTINMEGCTLNGKLFSYGDMNFTDCSFNQSNSDYHMWTYSGNLTYTGCTFTNSVTGKFLNVYNESGATKYTVTVNNCTFVNNASSANKAALNVKATSGSNLLAYDVIINNCTTEGAFPEASSSDALVVLNSLAQVDDRTASGVDNITVTQDGVLIYPATVAQIGETKYVSLQAALDAAHEMTGDVTITLLDDISNYSIVHQKAGLNLTIDGADKKVTSNIIVDGDGRGTGTETLTIQNIKFEGDGTDFCSGTSSFVEVPSTKTEGTPYYTSKYNYAHNITVTNCSFTSTTSGLTMAAIRSNSGAGAYNVVISDCTGTNLHSLAQLTGTTGGSITGNTVSGSESFVNVSGGAGEFVVSGNTFTSAEGADGYGIRENGTSAAVLNLTDNTFTATNAVVLGKGSSVTAGTINVISGTYVGDITKTDAATGKIVITDGHFSAPLADPAYAEFIGEGLCGVNGLYPEDTAAPNGIGTAVATVTNGTTVITYASLEAAFAAAVDGSTITLLKSTSGNGIKAPEGKFNTNGLTVDFGGFTYTVDGATVGSTGTETQAFQLLKNNKITFKNGTIYSEKALMLVQNYSDLTLQNMNLDGSSLLGSKDVYTLSNNNGNVVIDNSTITAKAGEGNYAFDVCRYASYPSVSVTVKGESVINGDVEVSASGGDAKDGFNLMFEAGTLNGEIVLDATAKAAMEAAPDKTDVSKSNALTAIAAPTDYKWVDNGDGTSSLAPCVYVAQIGEGESAVKYESLADAVAAVPADGTETTITMIADDAVASGITIAAGKNIVLELNGKVVSYNSPAGNTQALITNRGTLVIQDNTDTALNGTGTGLIGADYTNPDTGEIPGYASNTITNSGTLTVKSGKIINTATQGAACYVIDNNSTTNNAILNIEGGYVYRNRSQAVRMFCNSTTYQNTLNISGGIVEGGYAGFWTQLPGDGTNPSSSKKLATINITGGEVKGGEYSWYDYSFGDSFEAVEYNISGGKFTGYIYSYALANGAISGFISGGFYSPAPSSSYIKTPGYMFGPSEEVEGYYTLVPAEVDYSWTENGKDYHDYTTFNTPFTKNYLMDGETITLLQNITLTEDLTWNTEGDAAFTLNLGEFKITKGNFSIKLNPGQTVYTDKTTSIDAFSADEGYVVKSTKDENGKYFYTVEEAEVMYTAANGTVKYMLYSSTMVSSDGTYKLLKDVTTTARLAPGTMCSNCTLDLNGHTLTSTATDCAILLSRSGSSSKPKIFNLIDTSDEKGGILKVNPAVNIGIQVSGSYNQVTIGEGVTIDGDCVALLGSNQTLTVNGTINGGNDFAVATNGSSTKNATIIVNEGAVLTSDVAAMYLPGNEGLTATINGGTITGGNTGIELRAGQLVVNGGDITSTATGYSYTPNGSGTTTKGAAIAVVQHTTLLPIDAQILGGTLTGLNQIAVVDAQDNDLDGVSVKAKDDLIVTTTIPEDFKWASNGDGTSSLVPKTYVAQIGEGDAAVKYETLEEAFAAAVDGSTIKLLANTSGNGIIAPEGKFNTNGLTVDFAGFTYDVTGNLVGSSGTESQGFQLLKDNKITFKNGTVKSTDNAIFLVQNYSDLTLEDMTLTLSHSSRNDCYTLSNNNGTIVIDGTTINANEGGSFAFDVCRYAGYPSVSVTVTGESVINGDVEVSASGSDAKNGFYLMLDSGTINGDLVIDATAAAAMEATPDKAIIREKDSFGQAAPADFKWVSDGEGTGTSTLKAREYIAAIGTTKYETLQEAVDAAGTAATTITLLTEAATEGVISGDGVVVPSGSNITFDLNGLTYDVAGETVGSSGTETNGFQLLQGSDITFKNGTLKATSPTAQMLIQNYSNLTLEDVNLDGTGLSGWAYALSNNCGTINLTGSTSITAKTGGRAFDTCKFGSYAIPTVNINTTGAITGPIEATGGKLNIQNGKFNVTWVTDNNYSAGDIQIKGGIFSEEPAEEYLVEGYVTTENEDDETKTAYPYAVMTKEDAGIYDLYDLLASNTSHVPQKTIYTLEEDTPVKVVTYYREFSTTTANTRQCWMVPFDYTLTAEDLEKCTFYRVHMFSAPANQEGVVEDENEVVMKISELTAGYTLKANKPYIIKPKAAGVYEFVAENTTLKAKNTESLLTLSTSINDYDFYGVYDSYGPMAANQWFSLNTNGMLKWNAENQKLGPYRWYIKPTFTGDDYANIAFVIDEEAEGDETTTIDRLIYDPNAEIEGFYTVGGVKLDKPVRGLNIVKYTDGRTKKVYVK